MNQKSIKRSAGLRGLALVKSILVAALIGVGVVSFWRGVWYVWDVFTFRNPEDQLTSGLASLFAGIAVLVLLKSFGSTFAPPMDRGEASASREKSVE